MESNVVELAHPPQLALADKLGGVRRAQQASTAGSGYAGAAELGWRLRYPAYLDYALHVLQYSHPNLSEEHLR